MKVARFINIFVSLFLPRSLGAPGKRGGPLPRTRSAFSGGTEKDFPKGAGRDSGTCFLGEPETRRAAFRRSRGPQFRRARELPRSCAREIRVRNGKDGIS